MQPTELILTEAQKRLASYFGKVKMVDLPKIYILPQEHYGTFVNKFIPIRDRTRGISVYKNVDDGLIYVRLDNVSHFAKWIALLLAIVPQETNIEPFIDNQFELHNDISDITRYLNNYDEAIKRKMNRSELTIFSTKDIIKSVKKLKLKYELKKNFGGEKELLRIYFKNVKIGNEIEGYMRYKQIDLYLKPYSLTLVDSVFTFNHFKLTRSEYTPIPFHPHINSSFCFGNVSDEFNSYISNGFYDFALAIIKETVYHYDAENPYINISKLRRKIDFCEKMWRETESQRDNFQRIDLTCPACGEMAIRNSNGDIECLSQTCKMNPLYVDNCGLCGGARQVVYPLKLVSNGRGYMRFCPHCEIKCPYCGHYHSKSLECGSTNCIYNPTATIKCWKHTHRRTAGGRICVSNLVTLGERTATNAYKWYCIHHDRSELIKILSSDEYINNNHYDRLRERLK